MCGAGDLLEYQDHTPEQGEKICNKKTAESGTGKKFLRSGNERRNYSVSREGKSGGIIRRARRRRLAGPTGAQHQ